jgi:Tol biopolymer transport system component
MRWRLALVGATTALVAGAGVFFLTRPNVEAPSAVRFQVPTEAFPGSGMPLISDGRRLAIPIRRRDGQGVIMAIRSLDMLEWRPLPGTEGGSAPFWSADSRFLGFFAQGKLKKIAVTGGPAQVLCDAGAGGGGTWNASGTIVFAQTFASGLMRVSSAGGTPVPVTTLDTAKQERSHRWPSFLPDGRHFLFVAMSPTKIYVGSIDSNDRTELVASDSQAAYADGHLLFVRQGTLLAQPFDSVRSKVTGESFPVGEDVRFAGPIAQAAFSASTTGILAYRTGTASEPSQLVWFDRNGKPLSTVSDKVDQAAIALSPDGTRVLASLLDPVRNTRDLAIYDLHDGRRTRFTFDPADEFLSIWSPDGSSVVFQSSRKDDRMDLYRKAASGVGTEELLLADPKNGNSYPTSWSPDGRFILYQNGFATSTTSNDIWALPLSDRKPVAVVQTPFAEVEGQFSSDGHWIAYQSNESGGRPEVFVIPFAQPAQADGKAVRVSGKWQVSTAGGQWPRWRRDGKEIFYISLDNKLMAASVNGQSSAFQVGEVRPLFDTHIRTAVYLNYSSGRNYDVTADGQRFLINTVTEQAAPTPITVVLNWQAGLGARQK